MEQQIWLYGLAHGVFGPARPEGACEMREAAVEAGQQLPQQYAGIARVYRWYHTAGYSRRAVRFHNGLPGHIFVWPIPFHAATTSDTRPGDDVKIEQGT